MKITGINTYMSKEQHRNLVFIEIAADNGLTGVGEAYSVGPEEAVVAAVRYFEPWLTGMDPRNIEGIWQKLYRFSRFPGGFVLMSALSGIDIALWDLAGKSAGVPVWMLLGGKCRDRIRTYGHVSGTTISEMAAKTAEIIGKYGFTAVKCFPVPLKQDAVLPWREIIRETPKRLAAVRETAGDDVDVAVDVHAAVSNVACAVELVEAIKPYHPLFVEEPLRPENIDALAQLVRKVNIPVATGEMFYDKWSFRELLVREAAHIIQPDICIAGGITELKKIAALAESFHADVAPHNPMGPVATAANVHLCAAIPNFLILEYIPDDIAERCDIIDEPLAFSKGYLEIPDKPGLGVELRKEGLEKHPPITWHRPFRYHGDGSAAFI
ncbi:galactonate dehydratase [bacterium]|nr:galactonate dehydratase [bacterium]